MRETRDAFAHQDSAENGCFCLAMVPSVSPKTERAPAKVMTVSRESPAAPIGDPTSALTQKSHIISLGHFLRTSQNVAIPTIRIQGLKYPQGNYVRNCWDQATHPHSQHRRCGGRRRVRRARAGFETTRRAKLAARTASGRAAAHGHTKQPGPARHTEQPVPAGSRVRQRGGYRSTRPLVGSLSHCLVEAQAE